MHYKAPDNSLHVIEPEFAYMLPAGCVEITEAEADATRAANAPKRTAKDDIALLEATITPRRIREAVLGKDNGWLADIELKISQLRATL